MTTLIEPVQRDDVLIADIEATRDDADALRLWWLGQAGFLIQWDGYHLLLDPYLSDSLTAKYAGTDKPHVRMTARAVDPARLDMVDVATSSHNHSDHLDHETLWPLMAANPDITVVVPEANRDFAADRLGCALERFVGLAHGTTVDVGAFTLTGLAVAHEELETDAAGRHRCLGYLVRGGPWAIFHSGDAVPYDDMAGELLRLLDGRRLDVALLPINGRRPERRVPGCFWGDEAAQFARAVDAGVVIPMHYEMFTFNTESTELFVATASRLGQPYRVLRCGERYDHRSERQGATS